jgi:hypothetical protein
MKTKETSKYPEETYGFASELSTREQALAWWSNLPFNSSNNVSKTSYCKKYYGNFTLARTYDTLTDKEIEEIWRKETKEVRFIGGESLAISVGLKPNQKQSAANEIIDLVGEDNFKRIIKESDKRVNQKQFKQFDESLFRAYISKFSDEDKLKAFNILNEEFAYYSQEQMELVQKQHDEQVKFLQNKILELSK